MVNPKLAMITPGENPRISPSSIPTMNGNDVEENCQFRATEENNFYDGLYEKTKVYPVKSICDENISHLTHNSVPPTISVSIKPTYK